ncbi:hypothetical protein [Castellaniella sp. UC4442_H9]
MAKQIVEILQRNLERLVGPERRFPTAAALASRARVGTTTVQRARNGVSAIRIDNLEDMAHAVGLEAWQLLVEDLDIASPPTLKNSEKPAWPFNDLLTLEDYHSLRPEVKEAIREYIEMKVRNNPAKFRAKRAG